MSYLLIITISGVQDYISQARRTQDLLQGSRILSHLADKAVDIANANPNAMVIYPIRNNASNDEIAGTPNRVVVQVDNKENAIQIAKDMSQEIKDTWQQLSNVTFKYFTNDGMSSNEGLDAVTKIWERQVKDWLEVYWIVQEETSDYNDDYKLASQALASRKMLRDFKQIEEFGRKCSITGEHEALNDNKSYTEFWDGIRDNQDNLSLFGKHERLSSIATIKRIAHETKQGQAIYPALKLDNRFPSTSSIASIPFKYDVLKAIASDKDTSNLEQAIQEYIQALLAMFKREKDLFIKNPEHFEYLEQTIPHTVLDKTWVKNFRKIDGDFLYEDTLISSTIEEYSNQEPTPQQVKTAKLALGKLIKEASKCDITSPQPYYVILSMDGDNMGKLISCIANPDEHTKFSKTLGTYAQNDVIRIVQREHLGRVVYAGGDDVMALLPVRDALTIANKLREAFADAISKANIINEAGKAITATASTGLAYVHHTHNLQQAVREANDTQKYLAKKAQKRDALAIHFLRRSGESREMRHNWNANGKAITERIQDLVMQFSAGLGRSLPYDIGRIRYSMASSSVPQGARQAELGRVVKRRLPEGKSDLASEITDNVLAIVGNQEVENMDKQWLNALHWIELARFIAQSTQQEVNQ